MTITLQQIDGGPTYYADHGFTNAVSMGWDNPNFFPIGPFDSSYNSQTDVTTWSALGWNTDFADGGVTLSLAASHGISVIEQNLSGSYGTNVVGLLSQDEPSTFADGVSTPLSSTANSVQNGRFWWMNNTWSWDWGQGLSGAPAPGTPASILSDLVKTPDGTTRHIDINSIDLYWFAGSRDPSWSGYMLGSTGLGKLLYNLPSGMTTDQAQRGSNYGDLIDIERSYQAGSNPAPIYAIIEDGQPFTGSTNGSTYITPAELNWASWSSLIHGARGIIYFDHSFSGPGIGNVGVEDSYFQTVQPGESVSIYGQIQTTDALIKQLAPVLNSPFAVNYVSTVQNGYNYGQPNSLSLSGGIETMAKDYNGGFYIFADTRDSEKQTNISAKFILSDPNATSVSVIGENRTIQVVNGEFADTFATAATVHIYKVNDGSTVPTDPPGGSTTTDPPVAPVISRGMVNSNESVTLTGTALAGSTVTVSDGGSTPLGTATASSSGTWTFTTPALAAGSYAFTATDSTSAGTSAASNAVDLTVTSSPGSSPPPSGSNLVTNGNFETGTFSNWTVGGNSGLTPWGQQIDVETNGQGSSTYAAKIGSMGADGTLSQTITTTPGQTYTLSFWLQNEASGTQDNDFKAIWNGQTLLSLTDAAHSDYTQHTYTVTATASTSTLQFSAANGPSQWDLDNISLTTAGSTTTDPPAGSTTTDPPAAPVISRGVVNSNESVTLTGTAPAGSTVTVSDGGSTPLGTATAISSGAWTFTTAALAADSYAFTATDSTSAGTSAASNAVDVTVTSSSSSTGSPPPPSGSNLVGNGNFETGTFSNWTVGGNSGLTPWGQQIDVETNGQGDSTYAAKIGSMGADGTLSQTITTTPRQTYTLSFWLQNEASGRQDNDFKAIWNGQTLLSLTDAAHSGYTQHIYTVTATGSTSTLQFSAANGPSQWDLDNISLTPSASTTTSSSAAPVVSSATDTTSAGSSAVPNMALLVNHMASSFATTGHDQGGTTVIGQTANPTQQPLLSMPHH